jgi:nitrogen regulatory protein PII
MGAINIVLENIEEIADWKYKDAQIYSLEYLEKFNQMVKIESLCKDDKIETLCSIIESDSKTDHYNEGSIIIQQVEKFIPIAAK